jgi:hypothetical protein
MTKQDTIAKFIEACYLSIRCPRCGVERSEYELDGDDLAEYIYAKGWRVENNEIHCQHCTDNKR